MNEELPHCCGDDHSQPDFEPKAKVVDHGEGSTTSTSGHLTMNCRCRGCGKITKDESQCLECLVRARIHAVIEERVLVCVRKGTFAELERAKVYLDILCFFSN